jgi:hypothetical protein
MYNLNLIHYQQVGSLDSHEHMLVQGQRLYPSQMKWVKVYADLYGEIGEV